MSEGTHIERINAAMDTAIEAQEAGDFRTAETKARTAWMLVSAMPDSELRDERMKWSRESIQNIVTELTKRAQSMPAAGESRGAIIRPILVQYVREGQRCRD